MKYIKEFVDSRNKFNSIFGITAFDLTVAADRQRIAEIIDAELSPENLTCDGELSRSEVNRRYTRLVRAAEDLQKLDPTVKFYEFG
jgi:hypothetical protein